MSIPISNAIFEEKNNIEKIISKKIYLTKKNKINLNSSQLIAKNLKHSNF